MKRIVPLFLILLVTAHAPAQSPDQLFVQANQAYQRGRFAEALELYLRVQDAGYGGATLYYNLGNAYYKTGNIARAVLFYERARRLAPADDDLRHNLQMANLMIADRIEPAPRLFVMEWWDGVKAWLSLDGMTVAVVLLFALTMGGWSGMVLAASYRTRRLWFMAGLAGCVLTLLAVSLLWARVQDLHRADEAIVTETITTIKNSPDAASSDAFVLHAGVKVQITDAVAGWMKIRLADGKVGWMEQKAAEII